MKRSLFPAIILIGILASTTAYATSHFSEFEVKIKQFCAAEWADNYRMQSYCIDREMAALHDVALFIEEHPAGTEERKILARCMAKWKTQLGGYNYRMTRYCTDREVTAFRKLYR